MAWTTPRTWSPGETVTAQLMNLHVRDNLNIVKTPINDSGKIHAINSTYVESLAGLVIRLNTDGTTYSNVGTGQTNAAQYSLAAGLLAVNGQAIRITAWGTLANTANIKSIRFFFGSTEIFVMATVTANVGWTARCVVIRTGAATQRAMGDCAVHGAVSGAAVASPAETLSGAINTKITIASNAASDDTTLLGAMWEWIG
jgi:hypothetical protein